LRRRRRGKGDLENLKNKKRRERKEKREMESRSKKERGKGSRPKRKEVITSAGRQEKKIETNKKKLKRFNKDWQEKERTPHWGISLSQSREGEREGSRG